MAGNASTGNASTSFGLIGHPLGHSWSPQIHDRLGSVPYDLHDLEPDQVEDFVRNGDWKGMNVTIPYKPDAARLADVRSPRVERLGVANTLVRLPDGRILADNTDVLGFAWLLSDFCNRELGQSVHDALAGRPVCVLGDGGASHAVQAALEDTGADVSVISLFTDDNYDHFLERHADVELLVNTTPVGMFPKCPSSVLSLDTMSQLKSLRGVLDVVYNPTRTGICLNAEKLGLPYQSGLPMLVSQALYSSELFQEKDLDDAIVRQITDEILGQTGNIVLIGMPGAGKTSCGRHLAHLLGRPFVDLDDAFAVDHGITPADCIRERGEDAFRDLESETAAKYGAQSGLVIACGGGIVTRERNYDLLHQNGTIVLIDRPLDALSSAGRPLSQSKGVARLAEERMPLYRTWADHVVACTGTALGDATFIRELLGL